jgi:HK97 gp10 family phage protein
VATTTIKLTGMADVEDALRRLEDDFGNKMARSKVLVPAVREAMKPVLANARANAPVETGGLKRSLQVEARRPSRKDKNSKYVSSSDTVIALVTTAPGKKLAKMGIKSDARAIAQEFGTAKTPAHPYLRTALESQSASVVENLKAILVRRIDTFRKKMT